MVLLFAPVLVFGASTSTIDANLTPDSPFYFLKTWREQIQLFFTFNVEQKAKQYLHLAEVRLAEYQKMIEKGKTEIAEKTLNKYEDQLNRALAKAEELKNKGKDIKDLSQKVEEATSKHLQVLQENLAKVPEAAKEGLQRAIEASSKVLDKAIETVGRKGIRQLESEEHQGQMRDVKLYYYNRIKDKEIADYIPCSSDAVLAVGREIPVTNTPIQDTMKLLFTGIVSDDEKLKGFEPTSNRFSLVGANLKDGVLKLELSVLPGKSLGGSCLVNLIHKEIIKTASQFSGVNQVIVEPEWILQP